jgi:hypothetical protein
VVAVGSSAPAWLPPDERESLSHEPNGRHIFLKNVVDVAVRVRALLDAALKVPAGHDPDLVQQLAIRQAPTVHGDANCQREWHVCSHGAVVSNEVSVECKVDRTRRPKVDVSERDEPAG